MRTTPWQMLLFAMAGWINRYQQAKLEFCLEQIRTYKQLHGGKPLRLNDDQRRRLAAKGKELGLSGLRELVTLVTPETIMRWHRELIARKYDGSATRRHPLRAPPRGRHFGRTAPADHPEPTAQNQSSYQLTFDRILVSVHCVPGVGGHVEAEQRVGHERGREHGVELAPAVEAVVRAGVGAPTVARHENAGAGMPLALVGRKIEEHRDQLLPRVGVRTDTVAAGRGR